MRPWAHLAHSAHQAHTAMSMLDCPDDFQRENGPFSAFEKKKRVTDGPTDRPTDGPTDGQTDPLIEMRGRI